MFGINRLLLPPNVTELFYNISTIPVLGEGSSATPYPPPFPQTPPTPPSPPAPQPLPPPLTPALPPQPQPLPPAPPSPPPSNHGPETPIVQPITLGVNPGPPSGFELSPQPSIPIRGRGRMGPTSSATAPGLETRVWNAILTACLSLALLFKLL